MKTQFEKNIHSVWGKTGQAWLENLPSLCPDLSIGESSLRKSKLFLSETFLLPLIEIVSWSFIYSMISSSWSLSNGGSIPQESIEISHALYQLKKSFL